MASKKPVIHGRDHLPGGADPIPVAPITPVDVATLLNPAQGIYGDTTLTVPAGNANSVHASFSLIAGGDLDLTDPENPTVTERGVYVVSVSIPDSAGWNADKVLTCAITFGVVSFNGAMQQTRADSSGDMPGMSVTCAQMMNANQGFWVELFNDDSIDHDVTVDPIVVVRVYQY